MNPVCTRITESTLPRGTTLTASFCLPAMPANEMKEETKSNRPMTCACKIRPARLPPRSSATAFILAARAMNRIRRGKRHRCWRHKYCCPLLCCQTNFAAIYHHNLWYRRFCVYTICRNFTRIGLSFNCTNIEFIQIWQGWVSA